MAMIRTLLPRPRLLSCGWRFYSSKSSRKPLEIAAEMKEGDTLHGYTVNTVTEVPEFDLVAVQLIHNKTGAKHLHLARDDDDNAFGIAFRTVPKDSSGVAHILEHTVLCGSRKYPVRDPFFKMMNRSKATFMNAFTANDWTFYPFSTQNEADYLNLMSVYMDSVFHPLLRELDFRQEGWRLEHEDPENQHSPIVYKGVVFNEMKGYFASPENLYSQVAQSLLYPTTTYANVSGGYPTAILDLTWEQLKDFHSLHYHPSNARFFTYGNFSLRGHLKHLNQDFLQYYLQSEISTEIPYESRWLEPKEYCTVGPLQENVAKTAGRYFVGISFLLLPVTDAYHSLLFAVLSQLLVDGPASPFYQSLIESNLGSEYTPNTGYDTSAKESSFSVGLQGVEEEGIKPVKDAVWETLTKVSRKGFEEKRVESVLHQIQLRLKHQTSHFGQSLMMALVSPWIHNGSPTDFLLMKNNIEAIKKKSQGFWAECVRSHLLTNSHHVTLVMQMNGQYRETTMIKENTKIDRAISLFSVSEREQLFRDGVRLNQDQDESNRNVQCLPTLQISDIDQLSQTVCIHHEFAGSLPIQYSEQPTNNMTYFQALSGISHLPEELKIYVPLFGAAITQFETEKFDHRQFFQLWELYTSGMTVEAYTSAHYKSLLTYEQAVIFSSYCLNENISFMFNLWEELFCRFSPIDEQKLKTIITMAANKASMSVTAAGHMYAMRSAAEGLTPAASLSEVLSGLTQVRFLNELIEKSDLADVVTKLNRIATLLLSSKSLRCAVNTTTNWLPRVSKGTKMFLLSLPGIPLDVSTLSEGTVCQKTERRKEFGLGSPVKYVAKCFKTVPYIHEDSPRLEVLSKLLTMKYLHKEIREKGGAYGAGAVFRDGIFSLFSFRDPNADTTLQLFEKCINWCLHGGFSEEDVNEAKLMAIAELDRPISPGSRGSVMFLRHITPEMEQFHRQQIFLVHKHDIIGITARYLLDNSSYGSAVVG